MRKRSGENAPVFHQLQERAINHAHISTIKVCRALKKSNKRRQVLKSQREHRTTFFKKGCSFAFGPCGASASFISRDQLEAAGRDSTSELLRLFAGDGGWSRGSEPRRPSPVRVAEPSGGARSMGVPLRERGTPRQQFLSAKLGEEEMSPPQLFFFPLAEPHTECQATYAPPFTLPSRVRVGEGTSPSPSRQQGSAWGL